jgi:hypothetical protein
MVSLEALGRRFDSCRGRNGPGQSTYPPLKSEPPTRGWSTNGPLTRQLRATGRHAADTALLAVLYPPLYVAARWMDRDDKRHGHGRWTR